MAHVAGPSESTHLLVNTASEDSSPLQQNSKRVCISCPPSKYLCLPSKAAILILLWTAIVGATYHNIVGFSALLVLRNSTPNIVLSEYDPLPYAILAIIMMFYPLSGIIADVCCGRLKTVVISLLFLLFCWIIILLSLVLLASTSKHGIVISSLNHDQGLVAVILAAISLFTFIIALAGYQANYIQLGLDQLFEAPSQYLVLFIHYAMWVFRLGSLHLMLNFFMLMCINNQTKLGFLIIQVVVTFIFVILLLISCWKRRWFHSEPGYHNPYKTMYGIFKFAKSHKHPLRRSAFTHCDNYIPSRLDFAKERFGGPFTTEQVENVKTFLRILLVLLAIGPVFALEVPISYFIAPLFGIHFYHFHFKNPEYCRGKALLEYLVGAAGVLILPALILYPVGSFILFSLLRKKLLKLFTRIGVGILFCLLGVVCFLITDILGHTENISNSNNHTQCVFQATLSRHKSVTLYSLHMHWGVLVPPIILLGTGPLLVTATTLEFISAQSPQSMKGLLVGVFFAIRGLFQFLNSIIIFPLSLKQPWASEEMIEHPPVTNCGFVYLVLTSMTGLTGLILFSLAAKKYKYRTRDEGMFRQQDVEEVYDRYLAQTETYSYSYGSIGN